MQTKHTPGTRFQNSAAATEAAIDAYSWADECDRRDAERAKHYPVITPCLLMAFALAVFAVNLAVFGGEAW